MLINCIFTRFPKCCFLCHRSSLKWGDSESASVVPCGKAPTVASSRMTGLEFIRHYCRLSKLSRLAFILLLVPLAITWIQGFSARQASRALVVRYVCMPSVSSCSAWVCLGILGGSRGSSVGVRVPPPSKLFGWFLLTGSHGYLHALA